MNENTLTAQSPKAAWRTAFRIVRWTTYAAAIVSFLLIVHKKPPPLIETNPQAAARAEQKIQQTDQAVAAGQSATLRMDEMELDRKSTRLNSSHGYISYAVFCLKKKKKKIQSNGCGAYTREVVTHKR